MVLGDVQIEKMLGWKVLPAFMATIGVLLDVMDIVLFEARKGYCFRVRSKRAPHDYRIACLGVVVEKRVFIRT